VFLIALAVVCVSGFAALLYQVVWQRLLSIFSGADVFSATIIVASFMGGLGIGTAVGGRVADRLSGRAALALVGVAEIAVGVFGFFSAWLYHAVLYERVGHVDLQREAVAAILFASLLWPTFFMGASLPLLSRALARRIDRAAVAVGALYGVNTLGASAGALVSTWALLPAYGLEGSLEIGAALNLACALALLAAAWWTRGDDRAGAVDVATVVGDRPRHEWTSSFSFWMAVYGCSGFVALSYEIVWFRLLGVMVKSTAFTFGTLLGLYLAGLGLGAVVGSVFMSRVRHPRRAFFALQARSAVISMGTTP
jgi:spermidine synthase